MRMDGVVDRVALKVNFWVELGFLEPFWRASRGSSSVKASRDVPKCCHPQSSIHSLAKDNLVSRRMPDLDFWATRVLSSISTHFQFDPTSLGPHLIYDPASFWPLFHLILDSI